MLQCFVCSFILKVSEKKGQPVRVSFRKKLLLTELVLQLFYSFEVRLGTAGLCHAGLWGFSKALLQWVSCSLTNSMFRVYSFMYEKSSTSPRICTSSLFYTFVAENSLIQLSELHTTRGTFLELAIVVHQRQKSTIVQYIFHKAHIVDIATISHKSKLSLSKINRAVRLETSKETLIGAAYFQRNIHKLFQFMSFFHIIALYCIIGT